MEKDKIRRIYGLGLMALSLFLIALFTFGLRYASRPEVYYNEIQASIHKVELDIESCKSNPDVFSIYDNLGLGVFAFEGDSLVFWNNNSVDPRIMKRRVPMETDTICNLLTGDYLVKSFHHSDRSFYVFKLLQTSYNLENHYFENRFALFPILTQVEIRFSSNDANAFSIFSSANELLTRCSIETQTALKPIYVPIIRLIVIVLFLAGFLLLLSSFLAVQHLFERIRSREHPVAF